jgi:proline racemase
MAHPNGGLSVAAVDYHTGGEPFRIVEGLPLRGRTVAERREDAGRSFDHYRRLLTAEPRGHAGMYGGFVTGPDDPGAELGVVFFHKDGYSTACGHGTIALAAWAIDSGRVVTRAGERTRTVHIDVPSGRVQARVYLDGGRPERACFVNVPAWTAAREIPVATDAGKLTADVAFAGAFYACLPVPPGLPVHGRLQSLVALTREVRGQVEAAGLATHPSRAELSGLYGVVWFEEESAGAGAELTWNSTTVFADGAVDRSPCGSGTSACLALLCESGRLALGATLENYGPARSKFTARVSGVRRCGQRDLYETEIEGRAYLSGYHQFVYDPRDEVGLGFQLA